MRHTSRTPHFVGDLPFIHLTHPIAPISFGVNFPQTVMHGWHLEYGAEKELKKLINQKQTDALHQAVVQSGKTIEEVLTWINSDSQQVEGQW